MPKIMHGSGDMWLRSVWSGYGNISEGRNGSRLLSQGWQNMITSLNFPLFSISLNKIEFSQMSEVMGYDI